METFMNLCDKSRNILIVEWILACSLMDAAGVNSLTYFLPSVKDTNSGIFWIVFLLHFFRSRIAESPKFGKIMIPAQLMVHPEPLKRLKPIGLQLFKSLQTLLKFPASFTFYNFFYQSVTKHSLRRIYSILCHIDKL